jgi:hypothetical protein
MAPSCLQYLAECGSSLLCTAVDRGEVEGGRVAVVGKVDEAEGGATLEDEPPTVFRSGVVELRDDMSEVVVPLHNGGVHSVGVRCPMQGWRGACGPYAATSRSTLELVRLCVGQLWCSPMQVH